MNPLVVCCLVRLRFGDKGVLSFKGVFNVPALGC